MDKLTELTRLVEAQEQLQREYEERNDAWWNGLTEAEREDAFYAVVKRIYQGEIVDRGTYRYILYDIFGFGEHMYMQGVDCGFMVLHNSIYTQEEMRELRDRELASRGIEVETVKVKIDDC
jgi:hypothetical protein